MGSAPRKRAPPMLLFTFIISLWSFAGTPRRPVDLRQSPSYSPQATASSCALPMRLRQLRGDRIGSFVGQQSDTPQPRQSGSTVGTLRARRDSPQAAHFRAPKRGPGYPGPLLEVGNRSFRFETCLFDRMKPISYLFYN